MGEVDPILSPFFEYIYENLLIWIILLLILPIILSSVLPWLTLLTIWIVGIVYTIRGVILKKRFGNDIMNDSNDYFKEDRITLCKILDNLGYYFNGYEALGLEHIPDIGPAIIIYYHSPLPVDYYYLLFKIQVNKNRTLHSIVEYFMHNIPVFSTFLTLFRCPLINSNIREERHQVIIDELKAGNLIGISPGGLREAQFANYKNYQMVWREPTEPPPGFAIIAHKLGVPIIPVFTKNCREVFRNFEYFKSFYLRIFNIFKLPIVPVYGIYPVKLISFIGEPIMYNPQFDSPEIIRNKCYDALKILIDKHQDKPGSILKAFLERF